jgi:hypothetical protein
VSGRGRSRVPCRSASANVVTVLVTPKTPRLPHRRGSVLLCAITACGGGTSSGNPIEAVAAVGIAADRAHSEKGDVALGWNVEVDGVSQFVRWRECTTPSDCRPTTHERPLASLEGIERIGETTVTNDGQTVTVQVKRLRFGPPPANRPTLATEQQVRMNEAVPGP